MSAAIELDSWKYESSYASRDITWASLSETRNNRDKIAVSVSKRRTYVTKASAIWLTPTALKAKYHSISLTK